MMRFKLSDLAHWTDEEQDAALVYLQSRAIHRTPPELTWARAMPGWANELGYAEDGLPYRIASDPESPLYDAYCAHNIHVYIDGKRPTDCTLADRREGWVVVLDLKNRMRPVRVKGHVWFEEKNGKPVGELVDVIPR